MKALKRNTVVIAGIKFNKNFNWSTLEARANDLILKSEYFFENCDLDEDLDYDLNVYCDASKQSTCMQIRKKSKGYLGASEGHLSPITKMEFIKFLVNFYDTKSSTLHFVKCTSANNEHLLYYKEKFYSFHLKCQEALGAWHTDFIDYLECDGETPEKVIEVNQD